MKLRDLTDWGDMLMDYIDLAGSLVEIETMLLDAGYRPNEPLRAGATNNMDEAMCQSVLGRIQRLLDGEVTG
ncbi:MAG: hypothetical protein ACYTAN_15805 [Planctomycetota bacterium]|jgi:hypothetical protein